MCPLDLYADQERKKEKAGFSLPRKTCFSLLSLSKPDKANTSHFQISKRLKKRIEREREKERERKIFFLSFGLKGSRLEEEGSSVWNEETCIKDMWHWNRREDWSFHRKLVLLGEAVCVCARACVFMASCRSLKQQRKASWLWMYSMHESRREVGAHRIWNHALVMLLLLSKNLLETQI